MLAVRGGIVVATEIKVKLLKLEEDWLQWQEDLEAINAQIDAEFQAA